MIGDINGDGKINSVDPSLLLSLYADMAKSDEDADLETFFICDINRDGSIDARDASALLAYVADLNNGYPGTIIDYMYEFYGIIIHPHYYRIFKPAE